MRGRWDRVIERHGQPVALTRRRDGETLEVRAFVQPVRKEREAPPVTATPLGAVSRQRWLYLGSAGVPLEPGDRVACHGLLLAVQEAQVVFWMGETLYCRAILRREREAAL